MGFFNNIYDEKTKLQMHIKDVVSKYVAQRKFHGAKANVQIHLYSSKLTELPQGRYYPRVLWDDPKLRSDYHLFQGVYRQEIVPNGSEYKFKIEGGPEGWTMVDIYDLVPQLTKDGKYALSVEELIMERPMHAELLLSALLKVFPGLKIAICHIDEGGRRIWS